MQKNEAYYKYFQGVSYKVMNEKHSLQEETDQILSNLLDKIAFIAITLGLVTTIISVLRATSQGWHLNIILDIIFFICIFTAFQYRHRFNVRIAAAILLSILIIHSAANFFTLGLATISFVFLTGCCILATIFYNLKAGLITCLISSIIVIIAGVSIHFNFIKTIPNLQQYLNSPNTWATQIVTFIAFAMILLVTINNIKNRLWQTSLNLKKQTTALRKSEKKYRLLAENMRDVILIQDMELNIIYASSSTITMFGYTAKEIMSLKIEDYMCKKSLKKAIHTFSKYSKVTNGKEIEIPLLEFQYIKKNGSKFWGELKPSFLYDKNKKLIGTQGLLRDISKRKKAENQIIANLKEKEILLKEIHHRVKNNLNVICSLLNLQAHTIKSKDEALKAFQESTTRIHAISLVHEKIYKSDDFSKINIESYIKDLVLEIEKIFQDKKNIQIDIKAKNIFLDSNIAVPCGLILNELVTNAFKFAFKGKQNGSIGIYFAQQKKKNYTLIVKDNGIGIMKQINLKSIKSLGLEMVRVLTKQIHGDLELIKNNGTTFKITFPYRKN